MRIGGFGGVPGLVRYLHAHAVTHLVDATHPFAAQMSGNAITAAAQAGIPLLALTRPPWHPVPGDRWHSVADIGAATAALQGPPKSVMLALGRMHLAEFAAQSQHHYILRLVDAPTSPPPLPQHTIIVSRGPFDVDADTALMRHHKVDIVVAKNAGGTGAQAKLHAARLLGLPVVMVQRPMVAARREAGSVAEVLQWLDHSNAGSGTERGV